MRRHPLSHVRVLTLSRPLTRVRADPVYLLPSGYAFSIWSIIYLLIGAVVVMQALPSNVNDPSAPGSQLCATLRPWLSLALITNGAWLYLFSYQLFWAAFIDIVLYLAALIVLVKSINIDIAAEIGEPLYKQRLLAHAAFASNAAWVSVATCLQFQINLMEEGYYPSADLSVGLIVLVGGLAATRAFAKADLVWALVAAWALAAIVHNQRPESSWGCLDDVCASCDAAKQRICTNERAVPLGWSLACPADSAGTCVVAKSTTVTVACEVWIGLVAASFVAGVIRGLLSKRRKAAGDDAEYARAE